jgi:hypothetical protein
VSDDGATLNENWDGFWTANTRINGEGWFVEVRIPFSTIGSCRRQRARIMG